VTASSPAEDDARDPLDGDPRLPEYFGPAWTAVQGFHDLLVREGELRGLVGPRELARLWERHLLNSAAVVPFLPERGRIVDLGSGAGLPGIVVAALRPEAEVVLLEPMERRTDWLREVVQALGLDNAVVDRARADEAHGRLVADAVTARAVAPMDQLYRWAMPLLAPGGVLVALKGAKAQDELDSAVHVGRKLGVVEATVELAPSLAGLEPTRVVRAVKKGAPGVR